jgi:transcriptional regulator with XRE-family HTH domain
VAPRDRNIPTVRQRDLGARLRALRLDLNLTVEEVAERLLCSPTKISRLETATRPPMLRDVRDLCTLYSVDEAKAKQLMEMAQKAREPGWWAKYEDLDMPYIGLEQDAASITSYTMYYVPALLQTERYTRAVIKGIAPKIDTKILEDRIEARMRRQKLLEKDEPPRYRVLMDESVLCRPIGGRAVMREQLDRVLDVGRRGKATIQIIPFEIGAHAAQDSNFILLDFDDVELPPIAFVEGLAAHQYLEREEDIDRYREAIEYLRDSALSPRESKQRITEARDSYQGDR